MTRKLFSLVLALGAAVWVAGGARLAASPVLIGTYLEVPVPEDPLTTPRETRTTLVAWRVDEGLWDAERLDGLEVVAILESDGPLHDPTRGTIRAARVLVGRETSEAQRKALVSMAITLAPRYLDTIKQVEAIDLEFRHETTEVDATEEVASESRRDTPVEASPAAGDVARLHRFFLEAGRKLRIEIEVTESSGGCAGICGGDARPIPAVSESAHVHPATARSVRVDGVDARADELEKLGRPLAGAFAL